MRGYLRIVKRGGSQVVRLLGKKWAQRLAALVWRAAPGGALVVQTAPHGSRTLLMDQPSACSGASIAAIGLLFWPAAIFTIAVALRLRSARASRLQTQPQPATRRARPARAIRAFRPRIAGPPRPKPELH